MMQNEKNLNNISNNVSETLLKLKEKYNKRREYSQGYLDFMNENFKDTEDTSQLEAYKNRMNLSKRYETYLNRVKKINDLGI